jgi:hypothetical protein
MGTAYERLAGDRSKALQRLRSTNEFGQYVVRLAMSATAWVATLLVTFIALSLAQIAVRRFIGRMARRVERTGGDGTWADMIVERQHREGAAFEVDVVYWGWPILLGFGFGVAAALGGWGIGGSIVGFLLGLFCLSGSHGAYQVRDGASP